jgi:DNA ligase-1
MVRGLDGHFLEFNDVQSAVMKEDGEPDFVYMVFDYVKNDLRTPFSQRYLDLQEVVKTIASPHIQLLPQISVRSATELQAFFERSVAEGFEGAMYRKINSPYKCGRSTLREGWLIKIKLFDPAEAEIIGFNQGESNQNPEEYDAFGNVKRAHFKDGKVLKDELGSFIVKELDTGIVFDLSGKLSHNDRVQFWKNQKEYLGKVVRFKYQGRATDQGAKPRFPIFLGFRDRRDMD